MARPNLLAVDDDASVLEAVVQDLRRQYGAEYRVMRAASRYARSPYVSTSASAASGTSRPRNAFCRLSLRPIFEDEAGQSLRPGVHQVPGEAAQGRHRGHGDHAADHFGTAATGWSGGGQCGLLLRIHRLSFL